MSINITQLRSERPTLQQTQKYETTPNYISHKAYEDRVAILVCLIKIWEPDGNKWFDIPVADSDKCLTIRECESIEVTDSAKELINKTLVRFPRGTVVHISSKKDQKVTTGTAENGTETKAPLSKATNNGEVMAPDSYSYSDTNIPVTSIGAKYDEKGLIAFNRTKDDPQLLSPNDVAIGNRIEIRVGYAYSEKEFMEMNKGNGENLDIIFTGFITSISVNTPLEIECTNMGYVLSTYSAPNIPEKASIAVKDFFDENGYNILKDTGIPLAKCNEGCEITVNGSSITDNLTIADILDAWNKSGLICMLETLSDGSVQLRIGRAYYAGSGGIKNGSGDLPLNDRNYITYKGENKTITIIQFDWDVAKDKLSLKHNDKKYLAVEAHGMVTDKDTKQPKFFKFTLRKSPDDEDEGWMVDAKDQFQVVNEKEVSAKKKSKKKNGTKSPKKKSGLKNKVDLDQYTIVPYFATKSNITREELLAEAKQYWANYNPNGISGSIEIFGDLVIKPTDIVGLVDIRQQEKNGYYYVESVSTSFGTSGYRRELKLPFKMASFPQPVEII